MRVAVPGTDATSGAPVGRGWHGAAVALFVAVALVSMRGWLLHPDRLPPGDFGGYVSAVQHVHDLLRRHGRVPAWCSTSFAGTTHFTSNLKEYVAFPLALLFGSLWATKLMFLATKTAAAVGLYLVFARLFRAPAVGLLAGYAYGFGAAANHETEHLDVHVSAALFPVLLLGAVGALRSGRRAAAVAVGVLLACQLGVNAVQLVVAGGLVALLWTLGPGPGGRGRRPSVAAGTGCVFLVFGASQLAWLAGDLGHHLLIDPAIAAAQRHAFIEHSPFLFLNRGNWLGPWLASRGAPGIELALIDPERRYLGVVVLGVALGGWLLARADPVLRRWYQAAGLLLLFQYWAAIGPRTLLWQLARTLGWPTSVDAPLRWALTVAAGACLALAVPRLLRRRRWDAGRPFRGEALAAAALLLAFPAHSLLDATSGVLPFLALQRSPGHFFDLAPFSVSMLFGIGLVAASRAIRRRVVARALGGLVAAFVVVDFWPSTSAFEAGMPLGPLRAMQKAVARLPGEDGTLRMVVRPGQSAVNSLLGMHADVGIAWSWLLWQAGRHFPAFLTAAVLGDAETHATPEARRPLLAIARLRYLLLAYPSAARAEPPWTILASHAPYSLWEQPAVAPMASGYRSHVLVVGGVEAILPRLIAEAFPHHTLVVSGGERLSAVPAPVAAAATAVLCVDRAACPEPGPDGPAGRGRTTVLDPGQSGADAWATLRAERSPREPPFAVHYRRPAPERIVLELDAGAAAATVFVSEAHHPWWRATVDGRPAPVLRAQMAFMAVPVGAGARTVELRLRRPPVVAAADWVTALAWIALVTAAAASAMRVARRVDRSRRRAPRSP